MATKSFLKDITIRDRSACRKLISALERSEKRPRRDVAISKRCVKIKDHDVIRSMFGGK